MLRLDDAWIWDFWFAQDRDDYHVFYLKAPRSLGDADQRHWNARIGHAVSTDLRHWQVLPDALGPGEPGTFDDLATWTGSVFTHEGRHYLYYTGISRQDDGRVQRIGLATSDDLATWQRIDPAGPILEADGRWYETLDENIWHEEAWRDPWVYQERESGEFRMLLTARAKDGHTTGRGVIGQARSKDLITWEAMEPLVASGEYGHMECPQLIDLDGRYYLLFSVYSWAHSDLRKARIEPVTGTHYLVADSPTGPFESLTDTFFSGSPAGHVYAGKIIEDPEGRPVFLAFEQHDQDGHFLGHLADPVPVEVLADGRLIIPSATASHSQTPVASGE
jgi:beta-fructofuranosidase